MLNCFCYTGAFGLFALKGNCKQVVNVDVSQPALDIARQNAELNGFDMSRAEFVRADVFKLLREYREQGEKFDVIIMDHKVHRKQRPTGWRLPWLQRYQHAGHATAQSGRYAADLLLLRSDGIWPVPEKFWPTLRWMPNVRCNSLSNSRKQQITLY